jgi:YVTN family beta-propeller protein
VATFTGLAAAGSVGARTLKFTAGTVTSAASTTVTLSAGLPATVTITTQPGSPVQSGVAFPTVPEVTVTDGSGNLVPSQTVTVSVGSGGPLTFANGTATTNGSGVATFTGLSAIGLAGDRTLLFTAGTAVSASSSTVTVGAGSPAAVTINTQPGSPVQSGVTFPTVPVVTVTDGGGNPAAGQQVTVSVATGSALTFTNGTATTDINGVATFTGLAASGLVGARTLKFTAGTANSPNSSSVTVNPGLPFTVTITTQPSATVQTGVVFPTVPVVTVRDSATNLVPSSPVTVSVASGNPLTFTNGTATTNGTGVATFTGLIATGGVGARQLQFTAGTAVSAASNTVTVNGGPPASVTINTQPAATVQSAVIFPTVPVVTVKDASANPVANQAVTVAVVTGGVLTFTNGTATTDANGVATFTNLSAAGLIGARTLRFTAGTANSPASTSVQVNAGLAKVVTITTQPSATVQNGVPFPQVPVITVRDSTTNLVPNQLVTVSVGTGSPLTFTNGSATTDVNGVATFTNLSVSGATGARTLLFTAGTAVSVPSATVTLSVGILAQIVVTPASNMLLTAGATKQLVYSAQDAGGNPLNPQPPVDSWTSSNTSVATVSATGLVTAGATNGTVTITATIGSVSGTAKVMMGQVALVTDNGIPSGTVSILNGTTIQATVTAGNGPLDIAVTPDGSKAIVLNNQGSDLQFITLGTNEISPAIGSSNPRGISIEPAGLLAFIVRGSQGPGLEARNVSDGESVRFIPAKAPRYLVATATDVWVGDSGRTAGNGQVLRYTRSVGEFTDSVMVGMSPYGIDITPNGQFVYVANKDSNTVSKINTSTMTRVANIAVGSQPWGVKVTPNGNFVYVANSGANTVSVISTSTNLVTTTVTVGSNPKGLAITAAGDLVYVANSGSGTVSRIATATNTLSGSAITVGGTPSHIALRNVP